MQLSSCTVALDRCLNYEVSEVKRRIDALCRALTFSPSSGHKVLLKPNLVSGRRPDGLAVTNPQLVRAVAEWFIDQGVAVSVGDSPAFGTGASVMEQCGLTKALAGLPVKILPFTRPKNVRTANLISVSIAAEVFEHDLLVNLPKLKAHDQLRVTMAVKNYFGVVVSWRKAMAHMHYGDDGRFVRLLIDLLDLLPDSLSIIDGITAMHRRGPMNGEPLPLGILGASRNPVALDTALLAVIGLSPESSPLWLEAAHRNISGCRLAELTFPLAWPADLAVTTFRAPKRLDPIRFELWRFLRNSLTKIFKKG